jgi:hypothetical protein
VNRQKNLDKTKKVPVALTKEKALKLETLKVQDKDEKFKYNTMLLALVADKRKEGGCQQVHAGVSWYHKKSRIRSRCN